MARLDMSISVWKVTAGKLPSNGPQGAYFWRTFLLNERDLWKAVHKWKDPVAKFMS